MGGGYNARVLTRLLVHIAALLFVFYVVWGIRGSVLWAAVIMALICAAETPNSCASSGNKAWGA